jgi:hypothetical protein
VCVYVGGGASFYRELRVVPNARRAFYLSRHVHLRTLAHARSGDMYGSGGESKERGGGGEKMGGATTLRYLPVSTQWKVGSQEWQPQPRPPHRH